MINPENDGIDHINIYSRGRTDLGKFLSNFAYSPVHTPYGKFNSIEGLWFYLSTEDDRLRTLYGYEAKKLGSTLKNTSKVELLPEDEFRSIIKKAITSKIRNSKYLSEFINSKLPFTHYYCYGDKVVDVASKYQWLVDHFEHLRKVFNEI